MRRKEHLAASVIHGASRKCLTMLDAANVGLPYYHSRHDRPTLQLPHMIWF
jgi:hypothetical protein